MDHCPHLVAGGHLVPCLSHFCDLLSPAHRSRSIKGQSLKALIKVSGVNGCNGGVGGLIRAHRGELALVLCEGDKWDGHTFDALARKLHK